MLYPSRNPYTHELYAEYSSPSSKSIQITLELAQKGFVFWKQQSFAQRSELLKEVAKRLIDNKQQLAEIITNEMGKPITQALAEIEKSAFVCTYFAQHAAEMLQPEHIQSEYKISKTICQPLGVLLQIMPWNFPFWQVFRFAAPALMAGNAILLKHAPNVPQCALAIEQLFWNAHQTVFGNTFTPFKEALLENKQIKKVIESPIIQGVTLTGSNRAGAAVASLAGANIKKCILELGGSDACIILNDANLAKAAKESVWSRMQNTGQTCISAKRFIVTKEIADTFLEQIIEETNTLKLDNPMLPTTQLGTLARPDLLQTLDNQVKKSISLGAKYALEGGIVEGTNFYKPTILTHIPKNAPAYTEELFGPAISFFVVNTEQEAIALANDTPFGLGATIWTADFEKAEYLANQLDVGAVAINQLLKSDPRFTFGGIKQSGFGRELGKQGILEFVNLKSIAG